MQIIRECRMRDNSYWTCDECPELENQLVYVAKKWLTLAIICEQLTAGADRAAQKLSAPN